MIGYILTYIALQLIYFCTVKIVEFNPNESELDVFDDAVFDEAFIECILIFIGGMSAHFIGLCISVFNIYCMVNLERIWTRKDECNWSTFRAPFSHQFLGIRIDLIPVSNPLTRAKLSLNQ
eukprot:534030_1